MKVVEIFGSIDGEGKRTGQLATFIRLAGCNLRCYYCDTTYSFDTSNADEISIDDIVKKCEEIGYHNITLTGGEPLIQNDSQELIIKLCKKGFQVNVETNGSIDLRPFVIIREVNNLDLFFTVDYKTKYSLANNKMNKYSFNCLDVNKDIVKCVVANRQDMDDALNYLDSFTDSGFNKKFNIWFSPVFNQIEPKEIVEYIKEHNRQDITVQVQLHKIIWNPNERGI